MLTTTKQVSPSKGGAVYAAFVMDAMEAVRNYCINDAAIRVHIDATAMTAISFTADWLERKWGHRPITRRVYIETKLTDDGLISVIYMAKSFDENAVRVKYNQKTAPHIANDIQQFLRLNKLPVTVAVPTPLAA